MEQYQAPRSQVDQGSVQEYGDAKVFSVSGRIGRLRFLAYSVGVNLILSMPVAIINAVLAATTQPEIAAALILPVSLFFTFIQIIFYFMFAIQRSHDMNSSGWLSLIILIPIIGYLVFLFVPGTRGSNRYGLQPPPNTVGVWLLALIMPIVMFIGILAAIAIPAYQGYVERSQQLQMEQER